MEPIGAEVKTGENIIYYQCAKCGITHRVRAAKNDNLNELIKLSTNPIKMV